MCCFQIIHKCFLLTFCFLLCLWEATLFYKAYLWRVLRCIDSCCLCATTLSPPSQMISYHESYHIFTLSQMQLGVAEHRGSCSSQIALSRLRCTFVMSNPYLIMLPLIWVKKKIKTPTLLFFKQQWVQSLLLASLLLSTSFNYLQVDLRHSSWKMSCCCTSGMIQLILIHWLRPDNWRKEQSKFNISI